MIWKNPVAVNRENSCENSCENNLIDCSGLLKYHSEIPLKRLSDGPKNPSPLMGRFTRLRRR